jgi:hypothetical protein
MGILAKIFKAVPREQRKGICLDTTKPFWEISGDTDFPTLLRCLIGLLPEGCTLYFEGGSPGGSLAEFLEEHSVPEQAHVAYGTIWPRPRIYHLPAKSEVMAGLADQMERRVYPELAIHFHVYRGQTVLLEWHDVFAQPMLLAGEFAEPQVKAFCERANLRYSEGSQQPALSANER